MDKDVPNLFSYATKELSHDAFFCWLADCANSGNKEYQRMGRNFLNLLLEKLRFMNDKFEDLSLAGKEVDVYNQKENMDIIIVIKAKNSKDDIKVILIENKIKSTEHSNQLLNYKNKLLDNFESIFDYEGCELSEKNLGCIYLRPDYQSNYLTVFSAGFVPVHYDDLLPIFSEEEIVKEDTLLNSYYHFLLEKKNSLTWYDLYRSILKNDRFSQKIIGDIADYKNDLITKAEGNEMETKFLEELTEEKLKEMINSGYFLKRYFGKVNNPRGGFKGFWFGHRKYKSENYESSSFKIYLQFEAFNNLRSMRVGAVVKILNVEGVDKEKNDFKKDIQSELWDKAQEYNKIKKEIFSRPTRFAPGKKMTFAVLKAFENIKLKPSDNKDARAMIKRDNKNKWEIEDGLVDELIEGIEALECISQGLKEVN